MRPRDWWLSLAALLWIVAALGGNWLISKANHPGVPVTAVVQAWVQLVGGGALGWWAWRHARIAKSGPAA